MTDIEYLEILKENKDANFIALVDSVWQAEGVKACILFLKSKNKDLRGAIFCNIPEASINAIFDRKYLEENPGINVISDGKLERTHEGLSRKLEWLGAVPVCLKNNRNYDEIFLLQPTRSNHMIMRIASEAYKNKWFRNVIYDDGSETYIEDVMDLVAYTRAKEIDGSIIREKAYWIKYESLRKLNRFYDWIDYKKCAHLNMNLLERKNGRLVTNEKLADCYKTVLRDEEIENGDALKEIFDGKIILATTYFYEGSFPPDVDKSSYDSFFEAIERLGLQNQVVIKRHPREIGKSNYDKYGCRIIDNVPVSLESLVVGLNLKPRAVVAISSSSLFNLKALAGVKTVSLLEFFLRQDINKPNRRFFENYRKVFEGMIWFPNSVTEICKILEG